MKIREAVAVKGVGRVLLRVLSSVFLCGVMLLSMGCENGGGAELYEGALKDYEGARYAESYKAADHLVNRSGGETRDRARFLAGMSAYQLGKWNDTIRHLVTLTRNSDNAIAGPAAAQLGLAYAKTKQHSKAIVQFKIATTRLEGEDQAQAYYFLALSQEAVGQITQAKTNFTLANLKAKSAKLKGVTRSKNSSTGWTLQLGAFLSRAKAMDLYRRMSTGSKRAGLGEPRLVEVKDSKGKKLYLVQVGKFSTHDSALRGKERLKFKDAYIKRLGG